MVVNKSCPVYPIEGIEVASQSHCRNFNHPKSESNSQLNRYCPLVQSCHRFIQFFEAFMLYSLSSGELINCGVFFFKISVQAMAQSKQWVSDCTRSQRPVGQIQVECFRDEEEIQSDLAHEVQSNEKAKDCKPAQRNQVVWFEYCILQFRYFSWEKCVPH